MSPRRAILIVALVLAAAAGPAQARHRHHHGHHHRGHASLEGGSVIPNPEGCPRRLFCACGAAVRVFGHPDRNLWAAASWFRFPRSSPGSGMVAVRRHHVFVLEEQISGDVWMVYDANSGGHATRLHPRSIAGYVIVNPHAS